MIVLTLLSPMMSAATGVNNRVSWILTAFVVPLTISLFAYLLGHNLVKFWTVPVASVLPWIFALLLVLGWVPFLPEKSQQGGAMSGMIPMFGLIAAIGISIITSFFLGKDIAVETRIIWSVALSGIPALSVAILLSILFLKEGRSTIS
jgi:hypothetical protein